MAIQPADAEEVRIQTARRCKTAPLREELFKLQPGQALSVSYYDSTTGEGYRKSTIAHVAGVISRLRHPIHLTVRRSREGTGCYIVCSVLDG